MSQCCRKGWCRQDDLGATALNHAFTAKDTVISTDPTPSLSHIFEVKEKQKNRSKCWIPYLAELGQNRSQADVDKKFGGSFMRFSPLSLRFNYKDFVDIMSSILPGSERRVHGGLHQRVSKKAGSKNRSSGYRAAGANSGITETPRHAAGTSETGHAHLFSELKLGSEPKRRYWKSSRLGEIVQKPTCEFLKRMFAFIW